MSMVDFRQAAGRNLGPLPHGELDGLLEPLSPVERRDVRNVIVMVARGLATRSDDLRAFRVRIDGVIAALIGVVDAIDGDTDLEPTMTGSPSPGVSDECEGVSEDEGAQCDDEGVPDDNGLGDAAGAAEQGYGYWSPWPFD